jgi:hypothetical protein
MIVSQELRSHLNRLLPGSHEDRRSSRRHNESATRSAGHRRIVGMKDRATILGLRILHAHQVRDRSSRACLTSPRVSACALSRSLARCQHWRSDLGFDFEVKKRTRRGLRRYPDPRLPLPRAARAHVSAIGRSATHLTWARASTALGETAGAQRAKPVSTCEWGQLTRCGRSQARFDRTCCAPGR